MKRSMVVGMLLAALAAPIFPVYGQQAATAPRATTFPANDTQATAEQLKAKGKALRDDLRNLTGSERVNMELLSKRIDDVVVQLDHNKIELVQKRARIKAIAEKLAQLTEVAADDGKKDRVLEELQKTADIRNTGAKRMQELASHALASAADADQAVATAAEAQVKVEERREALASAAGGGILPELNRQLVQMSIDAEVLEQTNAALERQRRDLREVEDLSTELLMVQTMLAARFKESIDDE